jgi:hypothetical protein
MKVSFTYSQVSPAVEQVKTKAILRILAGAIKDQKQKEVKKYEECYTCVGAGVSTVGQHQADQARF